MSNNPPAIDVSETSLRQRGRILDILLIDRSLTTKRKIHNIRWATDSYVDQYHGDRRHRNTYSPTAEIRRELITGEHNLLIQPRAAKSSEEQVKRTKDRAEVFTPLNVVKVMNNDVEQNLHLPPDHTWQDYLSARWLEITCGEGPFITSRYDPTSSDKEIIHPYNIKRRVGFLDRKMQKVNENCDNIDDWLHWTEVALKACYGYEFQGDSLLIARENVLMTINDFYKIKFENNPNLASQAEADGGLATAQLEHFAEIISWNIFQMNGLNCTIPLTGEPKTDKPDITSISKNQITLFNMSTVTKKSKRMTTQKSPKYAKIMDWQTGKAVRFYHLSGSLERTRLWEPRSCVYKQEISNNHSL